MIFVNSSETVFNSVFEIKLQQRFFKRFKAKSWRIGSSMSEIDLAVRKSLTLIFPLTKFSIKSAPQNRFENRKNAVYCPLLPIALLFDSLPLTTTRDVIESKPKYFGFILFVPDQISMILDPKLVVTLPTFCPWIPACPYQIRSVFQTWVWNWFLN